MVTNVKFSHTRAQKYSTILIHFTETKRKIFGIFPSIANAFLHYQYSIPSYDLPYPVPCAKGQHGS